MSIYKLAKIGRGLIYVSLFLPLLIVPKTLWEFVFVRNLIFYGLTLVLICTAILYILKNKHLKYNNSVIFWLVFGFVILRFLSGVLGVDPHNSFFGTQPRMDGNIGYIMLFSWFTSIIIFLDTKDYWHKVFKISVFVATVSAIFSLAQAFFPDSYGFLAGKGEDVVFWKHRLIGTLGNSIFFAGYILINIFIALYLALISKSKRSKIIWLLLSLFFISIVILTQTRGAYIALAVSFFIIFVTFIFFTIKEKTTQFLRYILIGCVGLIGIIFLFREYLISLFKISLSLGTSGTRLLLWKIGFKGFVDKWFFGWGPENYSYLFSKFYNPQLLKFSFYETWADKPHNQFIEILATSGIFTFILFLLAVGYALYTLLKLIVENKEQRPSYLLIIGMIIAYLVHIFFAFDTLELRMLFLIILAFIIFLSSINEKEKGLISLKSVVIILVIAGFLIFGSVGVSTIKNTYYANRAHEAIINNQYGEIKKSLIEMQNAKSPYINGDWELLADDILQADAIGRLPAGVLRDILPLAIDGLERAVLKNGDNFSYNYRLAQMYNLAGIYMDNRYFDSAEDYLIRSRNISPDRQVADLLLAQVYYYKRDLPGALKLLKEMIDKNPNVIDPYWYLGIFYEASGDTDQAYAYMSTAIDSGYGFKTISEEILYVTVLGKKKDYERMAPIYESIVSKDKVNANWWANLATVYLELKKYDKAKDATRQAIFLDPLYGSEGEDFLHKIDVAQYGN